MNSLPTAPACATLPTRLKGARTPERDDIAAELMRVYLNVVAVDHQKVRELTHALFGGLEQRGYDRATCVEQVRGMAHRVQVRMARQSSREGRDCPPED
ncbi:MAG: hypothetical protein MIN69_16775 [Methylorubrum extorquens]|uniref:Uncharacterized protein n=1 Tax=Methylorubrum extorquens DSM 13060 TaxID=882800 RepID=H1KJ60_METEX|nr:hypothetical protein [Methylorubrum extorquens]EHP92439.1 hypothetical protein MetexDRAFT_2672 [Methylorubrum extorquens DSM 13060]KQO80476.1 hypothetical protein ASF36_09665 [Methylobacterium sp. Leaf90]MCG5249665.1 hypothetical protein [Methylorubrum extorquens]